MPPYASLEGEGGPTTPRRRAPTPHSLVGYPSWFYPINALLSSLLFGPLVVCFWYGPWTLLDVYFWPDNLADSGWICLSIGVVVNCAAFFLQDLFTRKLVPLPACAYVVSSRVYSLVMSTSAVMHWRGVWNILDAYTGEELPSAAGCFAAGVCALMVFRSYRNMLLSPLAFDTDVDRESYFTLVTRWKTKTSSRWHALDVLFTVGVVNSLTVVVYRGFWLLGDLYLFPQDDHPLYKTAVASLVMAYGIIILALLLQFPAAHISIRLERKSPWLQLIWEDFFRLFISLGPLALWRGVWFTIEVLILPADEDDMLRAVTMGTIGYLSSTILCVSNNIFGLTCEVDGELRDGEGARLPMPYLETIISAWRSRKERVEIPGQQTHTGTSAGTPAPATSEAAPLLNEQV